MKPIIMETKVPKETWKDIPGYKSLYKISSYGQVKSLARIVIGKDGKSYPIREKRLKQHEGVGDYYYVFLWKLGKQKTRSVHSLVALAFIGPRPKGKKSEQIRHLDSNPQNNFYKNLVYGSRKQNQDDRLGADTYSYGESHGRAELTFEKVGAIRKLYLKGSRVIDISRSFEVTEGNIRAIVHNKTWAPSKYKEQISKLEKEGKLKEAKRVDRELKVISPKGWLTQERT